MAAPDSKTETVAEPVANLRTTGTSGGPVTWLSHLTFILNEPYKFL